ncbi:unnamed protein product [Fusarium graminearum]|nr:unnamed protein product [Fusarium graminearum]CAG1976744.1 unnamed protein product [Fusarium graminearum]CAG2001079.1 unnamed protein product [Fusarium graminearum]VTO93413.1 unnamed protein product [Fusarium graminearum]
MSIVLPTHVGLPPDRDSDDVPRTIITSHGSIFKTAIPNDQENDNNGIKTETVWETMNPYTRTSQDSASIATPSSRRTRIEGTPDTTTQNDTQYYTASPTNSQNPDSLAGAIHDSGGWSDGDIAAVVLGVIFCLIVIALAVWFFIYKKRRSPTIHRVTPPQTPTSSPSPPSSPLPTPPIAELSSQGDQTSNIASSWVSYGDRVHSPTPQPAVAEVKSFTRAWQKPRVYTVTGGRVAELQGSKPSTRLDDGGDDGISPISSMSRAESSRAGRRVVSPMLLTSRFSSLSSRTDPGEEREESPRRGL